MSDQLHAFVAAARSQGLNDQRISQLLQESGWPQNQIELALTGLTVPKPPKHQTASTTPQKENSISALEAALQHVLLWVFTGTSTVMFAVMSAAMFGAESAPTDTLKTYLAIELITFIPFAILFSNYVRAFRKQTDLKTGRIWSIITIVLHSIGLTSSFITIVLALLLIDKPDERTAVAIGGAAIALINGFVVATYVAANFAKNTQDRLRNTFIITFPAVLGIITLIFGLYCLVQFGPIRKDEVTRKNMIAIVNGVRQYTKDNKKLPESLQVVAIDQDKTAGIRYTIKGMSEYQLCANFRRDTSSDYYQENYEIGDEYVSNYDFSETKKGTECFTVHASKLDRSGTYY